MTVSALNAGDIQHHTTLMSLETLTQSTATAIQTISTQIDITVLGMGTATGFARNKYLLSTSGAVEGMRKTIISNATGEANVLINNVGPTAGGTFNFNVAAQLFSTATTVDAVIGFSTATGSLVFNAPDDVVKLEFMGGLWRIQDLYGVTMATTT